MANRLAPIPIVLITNRILFENPWWQTDNIDPEYDAYKRRLYFELFFKLVEDTKVKRAVVLMGPRRVGKTVLMHHAIQQLLSRNKVPSRNICFFNIENPLYLNMGLEELFAMARQTVQNEDTKGWYVFFDEIQYLKDWERHLKILVDSYPHTKFIVSGSAAAALKLKSTESGAGRFTEFMLPPLTFHEYINLKEYDNIIVESNFTWNKKRTDLYTTNNIAKLNQHFVDYINFGGYPEVIFSDKIRANLEGYIKADIIDKVLLRDLPSLYGIQNVQELNAFFSTLVYYTGNELAYESLSVKSGVNKPTLTKYIEYLEAAFLIKIIRRIDDCGKKFQRQNYFKIYLTNPSLRSALFSPLEATNDAMGHMVETAIYAQWLHRESSIPYYARWKDGEVDLVNLDERDLKPTWAGEIKWSNSPYTHSNSELKNLIAFSQKNSIKNTIVTTLDETGQKEIGGVTINFLPAAVYAYNVGLTTILHQYNKMI
jgi:predicted AAA+ superfamily ATPase